MLERHHARTKILATLGPACGSLTRIREMVRAGADAFRLNMSHGDESSRELWVRRVHRVRKELDRPVAVLADLRGPRLRLGELPEPRELRRGEELALVAGRRAGAPRLPIDYARFTRDVAAGHRVLLRDGRAELKVLAVEGREVRCRVLRGAVVSSHQGVNLPDSRVSAPVLSRKDRADLAWAERAGVDWVALSFVRGAGDIATLRRAMERVGLDAPVVAKVELPEAVDNLDEILAAANGVMVARGDLAVEMGHAAVPLVQKQVIRSCLERGVPVITATQMLESMIESPQPTRAEVSDVANAVLDGTDALMLSGETAVGAHPVEAVRVMNTITERTERRLYSDPHATAAAPALLRGDGERRTRRFSSAVETATVNAAIAAAHQSRARLLLAFTETGRSARLLSSYRSGLPIVGMTSHRRSFHRMALYRGVRPAWMPKVGSVAQMYRQAARTLSQVSWLKPDDLIVTLTGTFSVSGATNTLRILRLSQLGSAESRTQGS